ncbi:signal peptidase [Sporolactobacillus sp. THM7-4]|nr:signal peptidase [Sporolactobacillus sp. THM7-4]
MKQARRSLYAVALLFLLFMMQQFGLMDSLISKMEGIEWWVYLVIAGILFSGFQAFTISRQDREADEEWTEKQGEIYIRRMNAEKERRHPKKDSKAIH